MTPLTPSNEPQFGVSQDDWSIISRFALASVGSQGTMGLALALGLVRQFLYCLSLIYKIICPRLEQFFILLKFIKKICEECSFIPRCSRLLAGG